MPFLLTVVKSVLQKQAELWIYYNSCFYNYRGTNLMYILEIFLLVWEQDKCESGGHI